jgi:translation initiation factor 1
VKIDRKSGGLVYSTDAGRMCPQCRLPIGRCTCSQRKASVESGGIVRISRETQGRRGKSVTVISGLALETDALTQLCKQLRTACGSGGTVKDGVIELQGDHRERVIEMLKKQKWIVERAGG